MLFFYNLVKSKDILVNIILSDKIILIILNINILTYLYK